ncbi:MAG TPA: EamA family transporter, partial [Acidimicrobiales bacterium]|nr:EamA family transporter [Acidimicrobiales bacterium]
YLAWGLTYLAIRVGDRHIPPLLLAGSRYVLAGGLLLPFGLRASRQAAERTGAAVPALGPRQWLAGGLVGILLLTIGNGGVTVAETRLPSGLAAVLVATVPLWMAVFAWPLQNQRVTWRAAAGLAVGLAGVLVLTGGGAAAGHAAGVAIVLGAALSWGFGSVLSHRLPLPGNALAAAAVEMLVGGGVLLVAAVASGELGRTHWAAVAPTSWLALAYLVLPGSILAFSAYGYALSHLPVSTVSTYAYVNPVVAVLAGVVFLRERVTLAEGVGAALVVGSVMVILSHAQRSQGIGAGRRAPPEEPAQGRP